MRATLPRLILLSTLLLLLVACNPTEESVDTEAIVATVSARLQAEQAAAPTAAPSATPLPSATPAPAATATATAEIAPTLVPTGNQDALLSQDTSLQSSLINVYQQTNMAVVFIVVPPIGSGTGFVYSDDGHIVTNNHVVAGGRSYEVVFANGERREATLVGSDIDSDLAVIQVEDLPAEVEPLPLGDGESLQVGQIVVAIGNPFGEEGSMSLGIISALGRSLESERDLGTGSSYSLPGAIQTDAPINPGNSGGPLLNLAGEVLGVNARIASTTGVNSGVGFAIPVEAIRQIVPHLIAEGSYEYSYMGAGFDDEVSLSEQSTYGLPQTQGAYVFSVTQGGPAEEAGLIAANSSTGRGGDLIVAIDDEPVGNFSDLNTYLSFHTEPGQTVLLTLLRNGEEIQLPLTLATRP